MAFPSHLRRSLLAAAGALGLVCPAFAERYAVFLRDDPVAKRFAKPRSEEARGYRQQIQSAQSALRDELAKRHVRVTTSVDSLLNAVFITTSPDRLAEIAALPGVLGIAPIRHHDLLLNRATSLVNGPQALSLSGGLTGSGAGIKIGVLDTGIDQTHPALTDNSLSIPAGFPKCNVQSDCAGFTNNKVIVARSYVSLLSADAPESRPDDFSARDHSGHGTAVASIAAATTATGSVTLNGMAPKAWLGNYRIFGSPTINDGTYEDVEVKALEDAVNDGMDIIVFSGGGPAFTAPLDTGASCGLASGVPCDVAASAFEAAARAGATIIVAAGNEGNSGFSYPLYGSITSPGDAPSVITVSASTNSHIFSALVRATGSAPANLTAIASMISDSSATGGALTAPLIDVTKLGNDGYACVALPNQTLNGAIALIERSPSGSATACSFATKMTNAVNAGAAGVVFYMAASGSLVQPTGLMAFPETAAIISNSDGINLKSYVDAHPGTIVTIDPAATEVTGVTPNRLASFSSFGPALGTGGMKPDLIAPGEALYVPTQSYDPLGELFSSNRFILPATPTSPSGTSFAAPFVAGAAALVKQNHPGYTAAQIKSALLNTATQDVTNDDQGAAVNILQTGPGKLAADLAIKSTITVSPASISFGAQQIVTVTNTGSSAVNLTLAASAPVSLSTATLSLASGASSTFTAALTAQQTPGIYSGAITIQGGAMPVRIPWMYITGTGIATNIEILTGDADDGTVNQVIPDGRAGYRLTDNYGNPVAGVPVSWVADPGITLSAASTVTDRYGAAYATVTMGPTPGSYYVHACVAAACSSSFNIDGGFGYDFAEFSRAAPAITAAGVVNAADYQQPIAPGSYITIFGTGLYDPTEMPTQRYIDIAISQPMPMSLDFTTVSFDVPSAGISVPCRMYFVTAGQVSCQVPWELEGQPSAQVKVSIDQTYGNTVTVPLASYAPAMFLAQGIAAATDSNGHVITTANPATRGQIITLYANGLGPVTNQPASGAPASATVQSLTTPNAATVSIGNQPATVSFSGLSPTEIGVYQINVQVPATISPGTQPVVITIGGVSSPAASLPVQ